MHKSRKKILSDQSVLPAGQIGMLVGQFDQTKSVFFVFQAALASAQPLRSYHHFYVKSVQKNDKSPNHATIIQKYQLSNSIVYLQHCLALALFSISIALNQHCLALALLRTSIAQHQHCLALALLSISITQHQHCLALSLLSISIAQHKQCLA